MAVQLYERRLVSFTVLKESYVRRREEVDFVLKRGGPCQAGTTEAAHGYRAGEQG